MIDIRDVTKIHHRGETEVHALRGVTCEIRKGSFTFISGPSGSGKSTLLHLIGALDEPTTGSVSIDGRDLAILSPRQRDEYRRNDVGFVFQNFNLIKNLNALDNVLVPFLPCGISAELRQRAVELLKRVGLGDRLEHRPNQLSGGEQQRVAIARALLKRPVLVLADEPTGELDTQSGAEVFRYLREIHKEQRTTVIVVSHDRRYVTPTDDVLEVEDGRLRNADAERF